VDSESVGVTWLDRSRVTPRSKCRPCVDVIHRNVDPSPLPAGQVPLALHVERPDARVGCSSVASAFRLLNRTMALHTVL
jgi:hypothetical protein